jgi:predicted nucleic acid-binding protein
LIVLDASAAVELVLGTRLGRVVADRLENPLLDVAVPSLLDVEVAHAVRRAVARSNVSEEHGEAALGVLAQLDLERHHHAHFLPRIWSLRTTMTAYDAAYVALAEALEAPLLTGDRRLARAPDLRCAVELIE